MRTKKCYTQTVKGIFHPGMDLTSYLMIASLLWEYTRCCFIRHARSTRRQAWRPGMNKEEGND
jgi:hypothetical protein